MDILGLRFHFTSNCTVIVVLLYVKYNLLISEWGSVKVFLWFSVSQLSFTFLCGRFCSFWGFCCFSCFFFVLNQAWSSTWHTVQEMSWSITKRNWKDKSSLGPNSLKAPPYTRKKFLAFTACLVEMHYILLPRQLVISVHGFGALLVFVITFK